MDYVRSPFFYVGDKYKLMWQLTKLFPSDISTYIEPFLWWGSSFLNVHADEYLLNDIDSWVIKLHKELSKYTKKEEKLFNELYKIIDIYWLSCSFLWITAPTELKKQFPKTYYAKYNKEWYNRLKQDFNQDKNNLLYLYLLLIYWFNHMIRFNSKWDFNLPVWDVDFNKNVSTALHNYLEICSWRKIQFYNKDYKLFLKNLKITDKKTFVFCDPPYLISASEYMKLRSEEEEINLYKTLDNLNNKWIKFWLTNLIQHKWKVNKILEEWSKKYFVYNINSNYISFNDNTIKKDSSELFITNYKK